MVRYHVVQKQGNFYKVVVQVRELAKTKTPMSLSGKSCELECVYMQPNGERALGNQFQEFNSSQVFHSHNVIFICSILKIDIISERAKQASSVMFVFN